MKAQKRKNSGFTLLEISMVLIIVGLIAGAIIVGRSLIHTASLRKLVSQHNEYSSAVSSFRLRYNCLPGDCGAAQSFGLGANGNGNGRIITSRISASDPMVEAPLFWEHLRAANFVDGFEDIGNSECFDRCKPLPFSATGNDGDGNMRQAFWWIASGVQFGEAGDPRINASVHYWWLTAATRGLSEGTATITPEDAFYVDNKLDDGVPMSGSVLAWGNTTSEEMVDLLEAGPSTGPGGAESNFCVGADRTPNYYNAANDSRVQNSLCSLMIKASF